MWAWSERQRKTLGGGPNAETLHVRSIVTSTDDELALEVDASQAPLVPFHRPRALARLEIPDLDLPIPRRRRHLAAVDPDRVDRSGVPTKGVKVAEIRARVNEEGGVLGAGDDVGRTESDVENALTVPSEDVGFGRGFRRDAGT